MHMCLFWSLIIIKYIFFLTGPSFQYSARSGLQATRRTRVACCRDLICMASPLRLQAARWFYMHAGLLWWGNSVCYLPLFLIPKLSLCLSYTICGDVITVSKPQVILYGNKVRDYSGHCVKRCSALETDDRVGENSMLSL